MRCASFSSLCALARHSSTNSAAELVDITRWPEQRGLRLQARRLSQPSIEKFLIYKQFKLKGSIGMVDIKKGLKDLTDKTKEVGKEAAEKTSEAVKKTKEKVK